VLTTRREPWPLDDAFRADWSALRRRSPGSSVFTDLAWIEAGIAHGLPADRRPAPLRVVDDAGATVALALWQEAPLPGRLGTLRTLRTIDNNTQRIPPVLAASVEAQADALAAAWAALGGRFDLIDLFKLDPLEGRLPQVRDRLRSAGVCARLRPFNEQPRLVLPASVDDLLHLRNKVSRKKLRWGTNRLEEHLGPLSLERLRAPADFDRVGLPALEGTLQGLIQRSWQGRAFTPATLQSTLAFYRAVVRAFAPRGLLDVSLLRAADRVLAFDLGLVEDGTVSMLIGAYDPDWARFSPGSVLFARWARDSLERGDRVLEFGGDYLEYKDHWATERVSSHHLRLFGRTVRGRLKALLEREP